MRKSWIASEKASTIYPAPVALCDAINSVNSLRWKKKLPASKKSSKTYFNLSLLQHKFSTWSFGWSLNVKVFWSISKLPSDGIPWSRSTDYLTISVSIYLFGLPPGKRAPSVWILYRCKNYLSFWAFIVPDSLKAKFCMLTCRLSSSHSL
jgi:hypothetical protein